MFAEILNIIFPIFFVLLLGYAAGRAHQFDGHHVAGINELVLKLEVDARAMRRNVDLTGGLVMSEALMMGLGSYIGREYAHDLVYDLCRESTRSGVPLIDLAAAHPEIARHADRAALATMLDP